MAKNSDNVCSILDLGLFTIQTPETFSLFTQHYFGQIKNKIFLPDSDALEFNYGSGILDIEEYKSLEIAHIWYKETETDEDGVRTVISTESGKMIEPVDSDLHHELIDGLDAKILIPQTPGKGMSGISFSDIGDAHLTFNLFGCLNPNNQRDFLEAIKTLKLKG